MNPNDSVRESILRYFYDRHTNGTSLRGKRGAAVRTMDMKSELKARFGFTQKEVISNLGYLLDKGWLIEETVEREFTTARGTTIPSEKTWFKISSTGVDHIEGESEFQKSSKFSGVNIHALGSNVITLGDGNIVQTKFREVGAAVEALRRQVAEANVDDGPKLELLADIDAFTAQLAKGAPDRTVMTALWAGISRAAQVAGFGESVAILTPLILGALT